MSTALEELDLIIKELDEITIVGEFGNLSHHLELGEKGGVFFVRRDGAILFVGEAERAIAVFYDQIGKVHDDELNDADPGFTTLREILVSRNKNIRENLDKLGNGRLSKALGFLEFSEDDTETTLLTNIKNLQSCSDSFAKEEEQKALAGTGGLGYVTTNEDFTIAPFVEDETPSPETTIPSEDMPPEAPENLTAPPKPNNVTHGSTMDDDKIYKDGSILKAQDIRLSTKAIILDSEGRILLLADSGPEKWDDLPGGHVQDNETLEDSLRREVFEETGLLVTSCKQLFIRGLLLGGSKVPRPVVFFMASAMGNIVLSEEHTDYTWADPRVLQAYNLGVFLPVILEALALEYDQVSNFEKDIGGTGGHEMEVTDLGQPYDTQTPRKLSTETKHHEPSAWDMGEPNAESDNVQSGRHQYGPREPMGEGQKVEVGAGLTEGGQLNPEGVYARSRGEDTLSLKIKMAPETSALVKTNYSEAGGKAEREALYIETDHDASTSSDSRTIGAFSSGAVIDLPEEMAEEVGGDRRAIGGHGSHGTDIGAVGTIGPVTTGDTYPPKELGQQHSDYDSSLASKQQDMSVVGTNEGIATLPTTDAYSEGHTRYSTSRHEYEEELRRKNETKRADLPPEQKPLGEGGSNLWLEESGGEASRWLDEGEQSPNTRGLSEGMDGKAHPGRFDEATEQYTNLSEDLMRQFIRKSGDSLTTLKESFAILDFEPLLKADAGKPLVVAGWGSYYVVDQEGHRIGLEGLRTALAKFLSRPEYANMNIFHSGIQVGKILPEFVDGSGKVWKTEVYPQGLFVVAEFRTDLEVCRRAMAEVLKGNLRGFSLAGNSNLETKEIRCEGGHCWSEITELEIYEVTLCQTPMNQKCWVTDIIQRPDPSSCPECFEAPVLGGYDASLRPK